MLAKQRQVLLALGAERLSQPSTTPSFSPAEGFSWSDLTLMPLCSFLLGLLVNNIVSRHWTTRTMVQDAMNTTAQIYFSLRVFSERTPEREKDELAAISTAFANIKRRLALSFRIMLLAARTDIHGDTKEIEATFARFREGPHPLLLEPEARALHTHRHAYTILGWVMRDILALADRGVLSAGSCQLGGLSKQPFRLLKLPHSSSPYRSRWRLFRIHLKTAFSRNRHPLFRPCSASICCCCWR